MTINVDISVNGTWQTVSEDPGTPLLWVLRESLDLTGTKFACGIGTCGACTVHLNGVAARSCVIPIDTLDGAEITTIEGLGRGGLHPVQQAWLDHQVAQCGYCQPGVIMAVAALLERHPASSGAELEQEISNICRCGSYPRIRLALATLLENRASEG